MREEYEDIVGLIEFGERITASFACPADATEVQRELYAALATWSKRARDDVRIEFEQLVARGRELDPSLGDGRHAVTLPVHRREVLARGGRRSLTTVFCPAERASVELDWCRGCPFVEGVSPEAVKCVPLVEAPRVDIAERRLGDDVLVGQVMAERHVCALPEAPAVEIARALAAEPGRPAVLVDDGDRLVGMVDAGAPASSPAQVPAVCLGRPTASVRESAPLSEAVDCMVKRHTRFLPVVRDDERVVGVLADIDALRWIASRRRSR